MKEHSLTEELADFMSTRDEWIINSVAVLAHPSQVLK